MSVKKIVALSIAGFLALVMAWDGWYIVPEGHVGIEKRFGKAVLQTDPGLRFKLPIVVRVEEIEVRQRKNVETLASATQNQLPFTADVSINWTVHKDAAMALFIEYGGLAQFEARVLDPKLRSSAKAAMARFPADQLIRNRALAVDEIMQELTTATEGLPITINSPQIEDIKLPATYMEAVMAKEKAREAAETEKHNLTRQKWEAQQQVQTANATRDSNMALADGNAYRLRIEAAAEAEAISLVNEQLAKSPAYVELVKAKAWDGKLPQTMLADGTNMLVSIGTK